MPNNKSYVKHILQIRQALQENRLAIFIGAGFSKAVNNAYPSWKKIIKELSDDMPQIQVKDFLQLAEHYRLKFGLQKTKEKIKSCFPCQDNPSKLHKQLIKLYPHYIITTNWDNILETSLKETSFFYDIIADDKELLTSVLDSKIIKMHGDFIHNNYVFTESDYLNYSKHFPLIEAYLKGIFTTHTILFLGYGFGDINLKLIITWLQNNSKKNKAHYMLVTTNSYNKYSRTYYSHYGITLLPFKQCKKEHFSKKDYIKFLNQLDIERLELDYITPEDYIYNQLKPLENLKHISSFQISQALTNCNITISNQINLLQFYDQTLTTDYNESKRELYKKFYLDLKEKGNSLSITQQKIIGILQKAFIVGIYFGDAFNSAEPFLFPSNHTYLTNNLAKLLSFNFNYKQLVYPNNELLQLLHEIVCSYNLSKYEKALNCCERFMKLSFKSKQYEYYFISLWNYNAIIFELKHNYIPKKVLRRKNLKWNNPYKNYENKDLEKIYNRMSTPIRTQCKYIYNNLTWEWLESKLIQTQNILTEIRTKISGINNGTLFFTNKVPIDFYYHQNFICFILENGILMEKAKPFKQICKNYFQIGLLRKKNNNQGKIDLSFIEIYSAIKYFTTTELQNFYKELCNENTEFSTTIDNINILIHDIFTNCLTIYTKFHIQDFTTYVCNILFLLKDFYLTRDNFTIILKKINNTISSANNHSYFFEAINNFFITQYYLCVQKSEFPIAKIFNIVSTLLNKFINNKTNLYEYQAIRNNALYIIYYIASENNYEFNDKNLLELLNIKIKKYDIREQIYIISSVYINLYKISNKECKIIINNYIKQIKENIFNEQLDFDIIYYKLALANINLHIITEEDITNYISYIEEINKKGIYDSRIETIFYLLKIMIENDEQNSSQNLFNKLFIFVKDIIENHNKEIKTFNSFI